MASRDTKRFKPPIRATAPTYSVEQQRAVMKPQQTTHFFKNKLALTVLLACAGCSFSAMAIIQADLDVKGAVLTTPSVSGQLSNDRQQLLRGAIIRLLGTNRETVTDATGRFRLDNLADGDYQLEVNYLGYGKKTAQVRVQNQQGQRLQLMLVPQPDVEVIRISGQREGQARALNMQRSADNIKSVVSSDYLGRFPDANVAESVQRLAGVAIQRDQGEGRYVNVRGAPLEFANVTVDGVVVPSPNGSTRAIDLDTIPADVISALEVTKAITPDLDADAIAGNINIVTQGALDSKQPFIRGSLGTGRNQKGHGDIRAGSITAGQQFADGKAGVLFSGTHSSTERVTDNVEHTWTQQASGQYLPTTTEFKDYELTRTRSGLSGRFDWRPSDLHRLYLAQHYSRFEDDEYRDTLTVELERFVAGSTSQQGVAGRATFDKELRHRKVQKTIKSTQFGGQSQLNDWQLDYSAAYSSATEAYPNRDYLIFRESSRPQLAFDFSNPDLPQYQVLDSKGAVLRTDFNFPTNQFNFRRYERRFGEAKETEQAYTLDFSHIGSIGEIESRWKLGVKARLKDKNNNEDRYRNAKGTGGPAYNAVIRDKQSQPFGGTYQNGAKYRTDFIQAYAALYENKDYLRLVPASTTADFDASEDIFALYAMNTLSWDNTTLVLGGRLEQTATEGSAARFDNTSGQVTPQQADNDYLKFFPSAHLRYELDNGVILRSAYSTGLNRPNFADLAPYFIVEERSTSGGSISIGNVDLKATYAHNIDLMAEYYLEPLGHLAGGLFYKDLQDPIFKARSKQSSGEFAGFDMTRPENGDSGRLYGMELNWQQTITALPGFGVMLNYTLAESSADLPFGIGKTDLPGTSRHTYNAALNYDNYGISAQLAYNYRTEYVDALDTADPALNIFWDKRGTLDFSTSYKLTAQLSIYAEATNLTDSKAIRYQGDRQRVFEHEQFGRAWQFGVRGNF